jgi:type II secretory pathway component PulF
MPATLQKPPRSDSQSNGAPDAKSQFTVTAEAIGASLDVGEGQTSTRRVRSIRKLEVAEFTSQLAIMIRSGVDISSALASLASQCSRPALADILHALRESVLAGSSLSGALKQHPAAFDSAFVATIAAGEASGKMSDVLQQLADMQRNEIRSARAIRGMLIYPVLLFMVSSAVIVALVLFVLPRFSELFDQYNMPLPMITQLLISVAEEFRTRWWLWLPLIAGSVAGLFAWRATESGRYRLDQFWVHGPIVGEVCRRIAIARMCRLIGLMLDNGVPLLESLQLTRQALSNVLYKDLLAELAEAVVNGQGMADVMHGAEIVPESAREMFITAEGTGKLNEVTKLLGAYYEEEAEAKTRQMISLAEPIITVFMGAIVAVVVLAVMLPVFDLSTFAGHGG